MNGELKHLVANPQSPAKINPAARCFPRGFTLVELLVVIAIIGVLAGMISVAAIKARKTAMNARMKMEVMSLDQALNAFKEKFGMFPPDGSDGANSTTVKQFVATAFPRYSGGMPSSFTVTPSNALYFWLAGPKGNGFSADPTDPFDQNSTQTARIGPFFDFDAARVKGSTGAYAYYPNNGVTSMTSTSASTVNGAPYLYFAASNGSYPGTSNPCNLTYTIGGNSNKATVQPYTDTRTGAMVNPKTFQILCPGLNGQYGGTGGSNQYPNGPYGQYQSDDITNFTKGSTLENDMP